MSNKNMELVDKPGYREPWPWILAAGPAIVVVAGIATAWIAVKSNDGLVTEDYYKKGLVVNQTIAQSDRATKLGIQGGVRVTAETLSVRLTAADKGFVLPPTLVVTVSHPTRAGHDQTRILQRNGDTYSGPYHLPSAGHWLVLMEDESKSWRLMGNMILPASGETLIGGAKAEYAPTAPVGN
jgi:hypothetical protein